MTKKGYEIGSRNVFKDIGVPNAEEPGAPGLARFETRDFVARSLG
jgi:hypothetical protein